MAFARKLVVIDLDGTLVSSQPYAINGCKTRCEEVRFEGGGTLYVYVRPFLERFLLELYDNPRNVLVLFSAGSFEYVHAVVERVIVPLMRERNKDWDFAAIYTGADLVDGRKNVERLCNELKLEASILIDDAWEICADSGATCYNLIKRFEPSDEHDRSLLYALDSPFFVFQ